jgi:hypothetical protein
MPNSSNESPIEDFWEDVRPERLPPADLSPYRELIELISTPVRLRETIVNEYLSTSRGREKLFESCITPSRDIIQARGPRYNQLLHLSIITRILLACDGSECIDTTLAQELILGLNELEVSR